MVQIQILRAREKRRVDIRLVMAHYFVSSGASIKS